MTRRIAWLLPLLSAIYAVWIGRDANWDLLNYHYYNVYALLHGRETFDLAAGQLQTFFNPLLYLPLYLGMEHLNPRLYAALLGGVQGINLVLVWSIADAAWPSEGSLRRSGPLLVALTAGCGAAFLTQVGTSFGDTLVTIPLLGALRLIVSRERKMSFIFIAGLLAGIACGFKPLNGIYAIAIAVALVTLPNRVRQLSLLASGGVVGFAVSGGWWCWHVWQRTGNPLFPYYNDIFKSPLYWNERFVFVFFLPTTWVETLFYPWVWIANPTRVSELPFFNLTIPAFMTLIAIIAIAWLLGLRAQGERTNDAAIRALFAFWIVGYALWLTQSSVYRFAAMLEMLAPLLVVALLARWVPPELLRVRVLVVLIPLMLISRPANFGRYAFVGRYMQTKPVEVPRGSMIAVAGGAPISYMVPAFPPGTPFVRIQSNMHGVAGKPNGLDVEARRRLETHKGPLFLLIAEGERSFADTILNHYHYRVDDAACRSIDGTLEGGGGAGPLTLCPLAVR